MPSMSQSAVSVHGVPHGLLPLHTADLCLLFRDQGTCNEKDEKEAKLL